MNKVFDPENYDSEAWRIERAWREGELAALEHMMLEEDRREDPLWLEWRADMWAWSRDCRAGSTPPSRPISEPEVWNRLAPIMAAGFPNDISSEGRRTLQMLAFEASHADKACTKKKLQLLWHLSALSTRPSLQIDQWMRSILCLLAVCPRALAARVLGYATKARARPVMSLTQAAR